MDENIVITIEPARENTQGKTKEEVLAEVFAKKSEEEEDLLYEKFKARLQAEGKIQ